MLVSIVRSKSKTASRAARTMKVILSRRVSFGGVNRRSKTYVAEANILTTRDE